MWMPTMILGLYPQAWLQDFVGQGRMLKVPINITPIKQAQLETSSLVTAYPYHPLKKPQPALFDSITYINAREIISVLVEHRPLSVGPGFDSPIQLRIFRSLKTSASL